MNPLTQKMSVNTGIGISSKRALLAMVVDDIAHDPEKPHCIIYDLNKGEMSDLGAFGFSGVAVQPGTKFDEVLVLGYFGELGIIEPDGSSQIVQLPNSRGPMRSLKVIDGTFFAVGTELQVFKSTNKEEWHDIGPTTALRGQYKKQHLERLDGFSCRELYATGSNGVLWYFDGAKWYPVQCATNARLLDVVCAADGFVYACGEFGTVVKGRHDNFEVVVSDPKFTTLWGIEHFEGKVYVSGITALLCLEEGVLIPELDAMSLSASFYDLNKSSDDTLWSIGAKDAITFRNGTWSPINHVSVV